MQVSNKVFYHIHKTGGPHDYLWVPGNRFTIGNKERNEFIRYFDTARIGIRFESDSITPASAAINRFLTLPKETQREQFPLCLEIAAKAIKEMGTYIRETIFEEIRRNEFPELPSRMQCVWVCEEKDIQYWMNKLHAGNKTVCRVSLTGIIHHANPENLVSDSIEHNLLRNHARQYWMADDLKEAPVQEVLFVGDVLVQEFLFANQ